jgi:tetratricopeptide (TPR) repeat protein
MGAQACFAAIVTWVALTSSGHARSLADGQAPTQSYAEMLTNAKALFNAGKFDQSLNVLEGCLGIRQDDPEVFKLIALGAIRLNRTAIAERALRNAARLAPDDYFIEFNMGAFYYTQSRFLDAEPVLERAAALKPDYLPALLFCGLNLEELGKEQKALEAYRKAIELEHLQRARNELPFLYLGRLLYRLDRFPEALPPLREATEMKPSSGEAWLLLGKTLKALGRDNESIDALQHAVAADPRSPEAHYLLSRAYLAQHREQDAQKELSSFEALRTSQSQLNDGRRRSQ